MHQEPELLSIVIPAFNEAANFNANTLASAYDYLTKRKQPFEMVLVNDGSTDATLSHMQRFAQHKPEVQVLDLPHQGKGPTLVAGMLAASGDVRIFADFDQSTPMVEIEKLLEAYNNGFEVVIGSREVVGSKRLGEPLIRHVMGKVFNMVVQTLALRGIQDSQCGFKLFSRKAVETLFPLLTVTNMPKKDAFTGAMDVELLFLARKKGFAIKEVPVVWHHVTSVRVAALKDSVRMFIDVVRIRLAYIRGRYV